MTSRPKNIKSLSEDDRPREKLLIKGKRSLSNAELLAILIGSGSQDLNAVELSQLILRELNNDINLLASLEVTDLLKFKGIGPAKAVTLVAAMELARRKASAPFAKKMAIKSSSDAHEAITPYISDLKVEEFWVAFLSRSNKIIQIENISKGGVHSTIVDKKVILKKLLNHLASGIILFHNHPSGSLKPSKQDIALTQGIKELCTLADSQLLDHIIVGQNGYYSFADEGLL